MPGMRAAFEQVLPCYCSCCILQTLTTDHSQPGPGWVRAGMADLGSQRQQHGNRTSGEADLLLDDNTGQKGIGLPADNSTQEPLGLR